MWRIVVLLVLGLFGCTGQTPVGFSNTDVTGSAIGQSLAGLKDSRGQERSIGEFHGKAVIVFFGYTSCPDVCPTTLARFAEVMKQLGAEADRVQVILISVDPARDTPESLKNYAAYFHPSLVGVTGTAEQIALLAKAFGAGYIKQPTRSDSSYAVDHSANTYLVGKIGKLLATLPYGAPADELRAAIRAAL